MWKENDLEMAPEPTPRKRRQKVIRNLVSIGGVISELGAVYRAYVRGEIPAQKAQVRRALLSELRAAVEGVELAKRLDEIEALVKAGDPAAPNVKPRLVSSQ
jgi:hypothetical protein